MRRTILGTSILACLTLCPATTAGQIDAPVEGIPRMAVIAGVGNSLGWFGAQGEWYFTQSLSAYLGSGYTPGDDPLDATGATFAAGARAYLGGSNHRFVVDLGLSQVRLLEGFVARRNGEPLPGSLPQQGRRDYGIGGQIGYSWVSNSGFTALFTTGFGYPIQGKNLGQYERLYSLGFGYTWR